MKDDRLQRLAWRETGSRQDTPRLSQLLMHYTQPHQRDRDIGPP